MVLRYFVCTRNGKDPHVGIQGSVSFSAPRTAGWKASALLSSLFQQASPSDSTTSDRLRFSSALRPDSVVSSLLCPFWTKVTGCGRHRALDHGGGLECLHIHPTPGTILKSDAALPYPDMFLLSSACWFHLRPPLSGRGEQMLGFLSPCTPDVCDPFLSARPLPVYVRPFL